MQKHFLSNARPASAARIRVASFALFSLLFSFGAVISGCEEKPAESETTTAETSSAELKGDTAEAEKHRIEVSQGPACDAHGAPKADCWICDPNLRESGRLWCTEHATYEDRCWKCHPELRDEKRLYCNEHGVYEDECILCHPELKQSRAPEAPESAEEAHASAGGQDQMANHAHEGPASGDQAKPGGLYCQEHRVYEEECAICHPELLQAAADARQPALKVRMPSGQAAGKAGVEVGPALELDAVATGSEYLCRTGFNENRLAQVVARVEGTVERVLVDKGDAVSRGQALLVLAGPEVAEAKAAFLTALSDSALEQAEFNRESQLQSRQISSRAALDLARAELTRARSILSAARQRLVNLGLSPQELESIAANQDASSLILLRAPLSGVVTERSAVAGTAVAAREPLLRIADLDTLWMRISLPADRALGLRPGARVAARFDGLVAQFPGEITWVSPELDATTRLVEARATLPNPGHHLKSGLFGKARVVAPAPRPETLDGDKPKAIPVGLPSGAVQRIEGGNYVFVPVEADLFEVRPVQVGARMGDGAVAIEAGLTPGEAVVMAGSFVLRSEMFKAQLGAGCAGDH